MTRITSLTIIAVIAIAIAVITVGITQIQTNAIPVKMVGHTETISLGLVAAEPNGSVHWNLSPGKVYLFYGDTFCQLAALGGSRDAGNAITLQFTETTLVKYDTICDDRRGYPLILTTGQDEKFELGDRIVLTHKSTPNRYLEVYREQTP